MVNNGLFKITLFALCLNFTFGNSFYNQSDYSLALNYTLDTIKTLKVKATCQTISDCSEDSLECRKEGNKSYCIYPEYICSGNDTCYLLNNRTVINDTTFINSLNATAECIEDKECPSNHCVSGQCQISDDSLVMYCKTTENMDNMVYQCGKLIGDHCESDSDCITSKCDANTKICLKNDATVNTTNNSNNSNNNDNNNSSKKSNVTMYVIIAIGAIIGIFLVVALVFACGESMQYVDENPELKEMREENRKKGVPGLVIFV